MQNNMKLSVEEEKTLRSLPCFQLDQPNELHEDISIEEITTGLSHRNFKVTVISKQGSINSYFAKNITDRQSAKQQLTIAALLAEQRAAPAIIYADNQWFVTEFIEGDILKTYSNSVSQKYQIVIEQMVQFHQNDSLLTVALSRLSPHRVLNNLSSAAKLTAAQQRIIDQIIAEFQLFTLNSTSGKPLTSQDTLSPKKKSTIVPLTDVSVVCHGDFNFSNLLVTADQNQSIDQCYVIDYETVCLAEPEYDIAMMVAVNEIDINVLDSLIDLYQQTSTHAYELSKKKVMRYLVFSLIINGLWYFERFRELNESAYKKLATQQFTLIDSLTNQRFLLAEQMR